jgi:hypothetical protein
MRTQRIGKLDIDQDRLCKELECCSHFEYSAAYNDFLCGQWRSAMLWNATGDPDESHISTYDGAVVKTKYAAQLPYLTSLVERSFNLKYLRFARIAILTPRSVIIPHRDLLELDTPMHRMHIPLITNPDCYSSEDNVVYQMRFSEAWFLDAARMHSAASFSDLDRMHLILDFANVEDPRALLNFNSNGAAGIPEENIYKRADLTAEERDTMLSLSRLINMENYKDIFAILIKNYFRRELGQETVWDLMSAISKNCRNQEVQRHTERQKEYFLLRR